MDTLEDLETKISLLMINTEESFVLIDLNLNIVAFNDQFKNLYFKFFGKEVIKGESILDYARTDRLGLVKEIYQNVFDGKIQESEIQVPNPNGLVQTYFIRYKPAYNEKGNIIGAFVTTTDISERKNTEKKLIQNEERLRTIIDNEPECVKVVDKYGNLLDMNYAGLKMIEAENLEQVKNKNVIDLIHPLDKKIYLDTHKQACLGNKGIARFRIIGLKNRELWMEMHCVPLQNAEGKIYAALSVTRDITKQIKAEKEKEFERIDKEALINSTRDSMWSVSKDFKLIAANNAFVNALRNATGITIKPGDNLLLNEYFPDEFISFWEKQYRRTLKGESYNEEIYFPPMNGQSEQWLDVSFNPIYNEVELTGLACYGRDITQTKKNEQRLLQLNEEIKRKVEELAISNKELEQFAYIASHDLQEPLRMITSFLSQLEKKYKEKLDEKAQQYIYFAVDGANRMRKIISDLLEYSRVGRQNFKIAPVSLEELLEEIKILNQITIEEKKAEIQTKNLTTIVCSKTSILQVFQNLIGNAIKYHRENTIPKIEISAKETDFFWEIIVSDNGIGINPEYFEKIFVLFQRLHTKEEYSGTGIGLAICKKIIETHQGNIWVESEIGVGSKSHFTISKKLGTN